VYSVYTNVSKRVIKNMCVRGCTIYVMATLYVAHGTVLYIDLTRFASSEKHVHAAMEYLYIYIRIRDRV